YREISDYEFEIDLSSPVANPLALFIFPIAASHQYKEKSDIGNSSLVPIGTGPYKIVSYEEGNKVILKENNDYWGKKPYIEEVDFKIVSDENAMISSFLSKEADFTFVKDFDWDKYREDSKINIYKYPRQIYVFLAPNLKKQVFSDVAVRKSIAYSIDVDKILREVYFKHGLKSDVPIRPDSWLYSPKIASLYSVKEAQRLLKEAGWSQINGLWTKGNTKLAFNLLVNTDNQYLLKVAQIIKANLKEMGIEINVISVSWDQLLKSIFSGNFDLVLMEWNLNYNQDISSLFMTKGKDNFMGYSNPKVGELFREIFLSTDEKSLKSSYYKLGELISDEQPVIGLYYIEGAVMSYDYVKGIDPTSFNVFNNIANWYLKK
ncbi:MAG: peptide ABC transporter substrate-binding protein, partial [Caldanaerobacter sp.]